MELNIALDCSVHCNTCYCMRVVVSTQLHVMQIDVG